MLKWKEDKRYILFLVLLSTVQLYIRMNNVHFRLLLFPFPILISMIDLLNIDSYSRQRRDIIFPFHWLQIPAPISAIVGTAFLIIGTAFIIIGTALTGNE